MDTTDVAFIGEYHWEKMITISSMGSERKCAIEFNITACLNDYVSFLNRLSDLMQEYVRSLWSYLMIAIPSPNPMNEER